MDRTQALADLHAAADRVWEEARTPNMDALAGAAADFIQETNLTDEYGEPCPLDRASLGYGIMLGWLARDAR